MVAAVVVWDTLDAALARQYSGWPRHQPVLDQLRLAHDGAYEWITDGRKPLARLVRESVERASDKLFAIEFVLPSYASEAVAISAAHVMARVFCHYTHHHEDLSGRLDDAVVSGSTDEVA